MNISPTKPKTRRLDILIVVPLVLATIAVYWRVAGFGFITLDDPIYVTKNPHVLGGLTRENIIWAFTAIHSANWHPLTWLSHMLDVQLFGLKPAGHHVTALVFHLANTLLLLFALKRMTGNLWRSAFVAALFAVHPLHVESVAWVAERKDVLSTFFWMLTLIAYARYVERPCVWRYLTVALALALGLMAKPMLVTLPIVLLLLDFWPLCRVEATGPPLPSRERVGVRGNVSTLVREKLPLFAICAASAVVTFLVQQHGGAVRTVEQYAPGVRLENALVAYVSYIGKMFWPAELSAFYPHPGSLPVWIVMASGLALAAATYLAVLARRKAPYVTVGWLWYIITLIPVIGLIQVGQQAMADRYTYVPLIGLFVMIGWGLPDLWRLVAGPKRMAYLAAPVLLVVAALMTFTWFQVSCWRDNVTLFRHALRVTSGHYGVRYVLANAFFDRGRTDEAISQIRLALRAKPDFAQAHNQLGFFLAKQGRLDEAVAQFHESLKIDPNQAEPHNNLGNIFLGGNRIEQALEEFRKATAIDPANAEAQYSIGAALVRLGRTDEAIARYRMALKIDPDLAEARCGLGMALTQRGDLDEAAYQCEKALKLQPKLAEAHYCLGAVLLRQRNLEGALNHLSEAVRINPKLAPAHQTYAIALYLNGDRARARNELHIAEKLGLRPDPRLKERLGE